MKRIILSAVTVLSLAVASPEPVEANGGYVLVQGTTNVYSYGYPATYWRYYSPGYYNGYYYSQGYYQQIYNYVPPTVNVQVNLPATPPENWQATALKEFARIDDQVKYKQVFDALTSYARQANGFQSRVAYGTGYGQYANLNLQAFSTSGTTGFAYNSGVTLPNNIDLEAADQRTAQLLSALGTLFDNGAKDRSDLLQLAHKNQSALLNQKIRNDALMAAVQALVNGPQQASSTSVQLQTGPAPLPQPAPVQPPPVGQGTAADLLNGLPADMVGSLWTESAKSCVKCHGPAKQEGGLDVRDEGKWDRATWDKVLARISPTAPDGKRMPMGADGKSLPPLPASVQAIWRKHATNRLVANVAPAKK